MFKQLHSKGIGTETKVTPVLSQVEENKLWDNGVLNLDTPIGLLRAVFFYNDKNFCLRGAIDGSPGVQLLESVLNQCISL